MSDQVRWAIRKSGLSGYAISAESGVSQGMISRFMNGKNDITLKTLQKMAPLIGVELKIRAPKRSSRKGR